MWSKKRKISHTYSMKSNFSRRRRKGKKSGRYTRFRPDPNPWQTSPPKTPPSSDDENDENNENMHNMHNTYRINSSAYHYQHHRLRQHIERAALNNIKNHKKTTKPMESTANSTNRNSSHNNKINRGSQTRSGPSSPEDQEAMYGMHSNPSPNIAISSVFAHSSCEAVAPAPIIIGIGDNSCRRRVKGKITKYVRMDQHNQTKLSAQEKTSVPLAFAIGGGEGIEAKKLKNKAITSKQKQFKQTHPKVEPKQKQKQTAPVPLPAHLRAPSKSAQETKTKQKVWASALPAQPHNPSKAKLSTKNQTRYSLMPSNHGHTSSVQILTETYFDIGTPKMNRNALSDLGCGNQKVRKEPTGLEDEEELIDFGLIPEAYFIGSDSNMEALTPNSEESHESFLDLPITPVAGTSQYSVKALPMIIDDENHTNHKHCNMKLKHINATKDIDSNNGDIVIYSPISAQNSLNAPGAEIDYGNHMLSDFINSNTQMMTSKTLKFNTSPNQLIEIQSVHEQEHVFPEQNSMNINTNTNEEGNVKRDHEEEVYFDRKFKLLAEQILEEKTPSATYSNNHKHGAVSYNNGNRVSSTAFDHQADYARDNICSEPCKCQYTYNSTADQSSMTTLGGLLMNGLPPINKELFH